MNFKQWYISFFHEINQLLFEPKKFWSERPHQGDPDNIVSQMFTPLVFVVGLAVFLGEIINSVEILWSYAFFRAIREIASYFLQFIIAVPVLAALLKNFGGTQNRTVVRVVLACTLVPFLLASLITALFPALYIISITGLYGFYIFVLGVLSQFEIPKENQTRYVILAILLIILIFGLVNIICWRLFQAFFPYGA